LHLPESSSLTTSDLRRLLHLLVRPAIPLRLAPPEAHWIMHRPVQSPDTESGLPRFLHLPAQPVTPFRVTPYRASIGGVGDLVAGSPAARSFDCCRRWISEATRISHPSTPQERRSGSPDSSRCLLRLRHGLRVSPCSASSGFAGDGSSRRVENRILRRCRLIVFGLPRTTILRYRRDQVPSFPGTCIFRRQLMNRSGFPRARSPSGFARENLQVTPKLLLPLAPPTVLAPDRPGALVHRWFRVTEFRFAPKRCPSAYHRCLLESPRFAATAGSMMNPGCPRTLHPRLAPRMNLRAQSGFAVPA